MYYTFSEIYNSFRDRGATILSFFNYISSQTPEQGHRDVIGDPVALVEAIYRRNEKEIFDWAFEIVRDKVTGEVSLLSGPIGGLHFNASKASPDILQGPYMYNTAIRMLTAAPTLWKLVGSLLDSKEAHKSNMDKYGLSTDVRDILETYRKQVEPDLGEIGGELAMDSDEEDDEDNPDPDVDEEELESETTAMDVDSAATGTESNRDDMTKRQRRRMERNRALIVIKTVVCISIMLQSTSQKCNFLQSIIGIFCHSTAVPEKVIETLAHAGLSVSLSSIHRIVKSFSIKAVNRLKASVRTMKTSFAYDNFDINFKVAQPTVEHPTLFVSATSATAIPLYDGGPLNLNLEAMKASQEMWDRSKLNPNPPRPLNHSQDSLQRTLDDMLSDSDHFAPAEGGLSVFERRLAWHVRNILIEHCPHDYFTHLRTQNGQPMAVNPIPLHKTTQIPCRAMNIKESTPDGNIEVVNNLLRQGGLGTPSDRSFSQNQDADMTDYVYLFHGDLLTIERLEGVQATRRIEQTAKNRFQFLIPVPGLFHFLMAAADCILRTWIPPDSRMDDNSLYAHVGIIRPNETGKMTTKPGYHRTLEVIQTDIWASMLDCWAIVAKDENPSWTSLEAFAKGEPSWDLIVSLSETIVQRYVATTESTSSHRRKGASHRDPVFENQCLRNRDELLFLETYHAMNAGDIGRVESTFLSWIYLFRATGKHKYSSHLLRFSHNLRHVYPKEISKIIRMNWLVNPTGKMHGFRGVDWLVERNNLYTKVIYGGHGSNRTLSRILEESILIEIFRESHLAIELGFHLKHRTIRHSPPNMTRTVTALLAHLKATEPHSFKPGLESRKTNWTAPDNIAVGMDQVEDALYVKGKGQDIGTGEDNELDESEVVEVEPEDLL
ncbi:hypothetical protein D9611_001386 [Ephemerocybe angulata]|uniref:DUF6589 domain-containing protein n=1 Tax=Ephemerocybe angulata TaxID=980116 RepID=A0A8H5FMP7_9AGAR|nr:hypothetical protein D9611_001386 [Tulosesus angulatus]